MQVLPGRVSGTQKAPPSKSSMQRAVACAALAGGVSTIRSPSYCDDSLAALGIAASLGARVEAGADRLVISGSPAFSDSTAELELDCGESGLCMRMFAPIAALRPGPTRLIARGSLRTRAVGMATGAIRAFGGSCEDEAGRPPLSVRGPLAGGEAAIEAGESSQVLTGLLIALPLAAGDSRLEVRGLASKGYVDLTLATMRAFGIEIERSASDSGIVFAVRGGRAYRPRDFSVEGDWSGAAFLLVAAAIAGGGAPLAVEGLDVRSAQPDRAVLDALGDAGTRVSVGPGRLTVEACATQAFRFDARDCPDLFPPLAALAARCRGRSELRGVSRLRGKESDRALAIVDALGSMGIEAGIEADAMLIRGGSPREAEVDARGDHRIAMMAAALALASSGPVSIRGAECVSKSWPEFFTALGRLGAGLRETA